MTMDSPLPLEMYVTPRVRERVDWVVTCPPCHLSVTFHRREMLERFLEQHPGQCRQLGHHGNCDRACTRPPPSDCSSR